MIAVWMRLSAAVESGVNFTPRLVERNEGLMEEIERRVRGLKDRVERGEVEVLRQKRFQLYSIIWKGDFEIISYISLGTLNVMSRNK